jgi:hypothetical protein
MLSLMVQTTLKSLHSKFQKAATVENAKNDF